MSLYMDDPRLQPEDYVAICTECNARLYKNDKIVEGMCADCVENAYNEWERISETEG